MRLDPANLRERLLPLDFATLSRYTTKSELAKLLKLHRNSVTNYHRKARLIYEEYRQDALVNRYLTRYQCWIIWFIQVKYLENRGDSKAAMRELREARPLLTKSKFEWLQRQQPQRRKTQVLRSN